MCLIMLLKGFKVQARAAWRFIEANILSSDCPGPVAQSV